MPHEISLCSCCGYSCRVSRDGADIPDYTEKTGRNKMPVAYVERKFHERLTYLQTLISPHFRIVEIGCAEGELGKRIKQQVASVEYWGIEPSKDSLTAALHLDNVFPNAEALKASCCKESFDLLLAFHVLEHIGDISTELDTWRGLLKCGGAAVIEVPNKSGNQLVLHDGNVEHLHSFSTSSLSVLANREGFDIVSMTTGHYESPAYNDCIRAKLRLSPPPSRINQSFIEKIVNTIHKPFSIFGLGGDFRSFLAPIFDQLPVRSLIDNNQDLQGVTVCGVQVEAYNSEYHGSSPILVASIRHERQIIQTLRACDHPDSSIFSLASLLDS
jgi:hypothetical protein